MSRITHIHAREVFDSRGRPTVEVEVRCGAARPGRAIVPSGASTGQFEALELRDTDDSRLDGTGVRRAVRNVTDIIAPAVIGQDATDQATIDRMLCELDGTESKSLLGANAILGVSLAAAHAAAEAEGTPLVEHLHRLWRRISETGTASEPAQRTAALGRRPLLPLPMVNMISGGLHAGGNLDLQDVLAIPIGAASYRQALEWIVTVYRRLGTLLHDAGHEGRLVGDEGGYGPRLASNSQAIEFVIAAIEAARLRPGEDVAIGLDVAASHFFRDGAYHLAATGGDRRLGPAEFIETLAEWTHKYPILSIEDGLADDDWDHWQTLTEQLAGRVQLIGDDLFATNPARLRRGIERGVAN
ncbi:MAG: phosphopyruvate hydratase, partial [Planctomycetaceae bacterium]